MDDREARMALTCVVEPGTSRVTELVAEFGALAVWQGILSSTGNPTLAQRAAVLDLREVADSAARAKISFTCPGEPGWPDQVAELDGCEPVRQLGGAPFGLWHRGEAVLSDVLTRSVAIVGSRAATAYGETAASDIAAGVAGQGMTVVSGGAYGIDAAAHRGALSVEGLTVAVMAGGLDRPYPAGNAALFERIARYGLLVSELPPGQHPTRVRFLARNRLIAAMSPGTVMVEAAVRSGARNTVTWANACHRLVMAVPGPVHSVNSVTPHRLIRDQEAVLVTGSQDVLELLGPVGRPGKALAREHRPLDVLEADELAVYEALPARAALAAGELSLRSSTPLPLTLGILDALEERGLVESTPGGRWRIVPGAAQGRPQLNLTPEETPE